ncbi:MAG: response regulator transcription factor [Gammaproteobacteria bacterium]|nr:response regulator transcription factor [Gammaproteobacteria bacterium]MCW8987694.1 response regulator transcription factor [Gammaproteobacteria bacterium]MCW9032300.1 response regulator transcription factor [Gammaproteobacteria bacterium]
MRLLIIEDEPHIREQLQQYLQQQGYAVDTAEDGRAGLFMGSEYPFDLAIVDLGLPEISGIDVIQQWRDRGKKFPVLILTARGKWQDKVQGLEAGADDYLVKPFHNEELLARTRALLRRASGVSQPVIQFDSISINTSKKTVSLNDTELELTAYEYKVIEYLVMNSDKVISKTELTEHIYEQDFDRDSNVIEVFVGRLRKKLDLNGELKPIETLRGRGYRWNLTATNKESNP